MTSPSIVRGYPVPGPAGLGQPETCTVATKPAPSARPLNHIVYVSDDNGGTLYWNPTTAAWVKLAASANSGNGSELYFNELAANQTATTAADATLWTATVTVGTRPIEMFASITVGGTSAVPAGFEMREGATKLESQSVVAPTTSPVATVKMFKRLTPSAGSHTYTLVAIKPSAGTLTYYTPVPTFGLTGSSFSILER